MITLERERESCIMAHNCKQGDGDETVLNSEADVPNVHTNVYTCGGCSSIFETICVLHAHMQSHASGSYHYDHFYSTAFPKYGCMCMGSHTDFDSGLVQCKSTGSQTDLTINDISDILTRFSSMTSYNCSLAGDFNNFNARDDIVFQNKSNDVKMKKGLGYLNACISDMSCGEAEAEIKNHEKANERMIKVEKNDDNIMENFDEDEAEDQIPDLGNSANDKSYLGPNYVRITDGERSESGYNSLFGRKKIPEEASSFKAEFKVDTVKSKEKDKRIKDNIDFLMDDKSSIECQICEKKFTSSSAWKRHMIIVHSEQKRNKSSGQFPCKYCNSSLRCKKELLKHVKEDHNENEKKYSCPYCEDELLTSATKTVHMDSEHPEIMLVLKKFHQSKDTDTHAACDLCGKLFSTAAGLALHMSSIHLKKRFKCDICNVELSQKFTLKAHKIEKHHENMRGFDCNICKKTFAYKFRLKAHIEQMHTPPEEKGNKYICETCGYFAKSKAGLRYHLTKHDEQRKQYQCSVCPYKTYYKCSMTEHVTSHQGNRRFICDVCGDKFFTGKQLKVHMRRHTGELPYQCDICNKKFRTDIAYTRHRDIHLNKMRFKCDYCDKEFVQKTNCSAHMRQHTGEKPFKCDWCGQGFTHNVSRKNHMNKCTYKPPELNLTETISLS